MIPAELRLKETEEIEALVNEKREQLFRWKMLHHTGQLDVISRLKQTRREIARMLTILSERERAEQLSEGTE